MLAEGSLEGTRGQPFRVGCVAGGILFGMPLQPKVDLGSTTMGKQNIGIYMYLATFQDYVDAEPMTMCPSSTKSAICWSM